MRSLFPYPDLYIEQFRKRHHINISKEFVSCANFQLTNSFEDYTGLKITKFVVFGWAPEYRFFYSKGKISRFDSEIWISNYNNPVVIAWTSNSGRIYEPDDTDIDCKDIRFWCEGLNPLLYHQQMFPKVSLPFKLKNLNYELKINRLNVNWTVSMKLKKEEVNNTLIRTYEVDKFIDDFNTRAERNDRKDGVVHSWKSVIEDDELVYEIDSGSGGVIFLREFLQFLSKRNCFEKVQVD
jgi:hypothetical protein